MSIHSPAYQPRRLLNRSALRSARLTRRRAHVAPRRIRVGAHAQGPQRRSDRGVRDSRRQARCDDIDGQDGARLALRRRRARAHAQKGSHRRLAKVMRESMWA
eukprot:2664725-Pleurochrysis_carterae.AAC.1